MVEGKTDFINMIKKNLAQLLLEKIEVDHSLKRIDVKGGSIDLSIYKTQKIEKIIFLTIKIYESSTSEQSLMVCPEDNYDLPLFWCNLSQMAGMNIFINDLSPLTDVVIWPDYGEKYLNDLQAIKDHALESMKDGIVDKDFKLNTKTAWTLSPHRTIFSLTDESIQQLRPIVDECCQLYLKLWKDSVPINQDEEAQFCKRKKAAVKKMMKENDPGYYYMINIFGEENTRKVFDLIF